MVVVDWGRIYRLVEYVGVVVIGYGVGSKVGGEGGEWVCERVGRRGKGGERIEVWGVIEGGGMYVWRDCEGCVGVV